MSTHYNGKDKEEEVIGKAELAQVDNLNVNVEDIVLENEVIARRNETHQNEVNVPAGETQNEPNEGDEGERVVQAPGAIRVNGRLGGSLASGIVGGDSERVFQSYLVNEEEEAAYFLREGERIA